MKVKELREKLSKCSPESDVYIVDYGTLNKLGYVDINSDSGNVELTRD